MSDFSTPQKLAPIALFRVFSRILKSLFAQIWPLLFAYFFSVSRNPEREDSGIGMLVVIYGVLGLTVISGIIRYLTYRWSVDEDALIIKHGVFRKVNLRIPFERIQAIDLQQPWYYRLGGAVRFVVDTAGSKTKEAEIWALQLPMAEELRAFIHEKKKEGVTDEESETAQVATVAKEWIFVDALFLAKIGLFRNHFRSIAAFFGGAFYIYSQLQDVMSSEDINAELEQVYDVIPKVYSVFMILGFLVVFAAVVFSILFTIVRFYNFKLVESRGVFVAKYGLVNTKTKQVKPEKIQIIRTEQGPVFKWLGILKFKIEQAYAQKNNKEDFTIPGSPTKEVLAFRERVFGFVGQYIHPSTSVKWISYRVIRLGVLPLIIPGIIYGITLDSDYLWTALLLPIQIGYSYLLWKNQGVYMDEDKLSIRRKVIVEKTATIVLERVQAVQINQSIFQRRNALATVVVETAGGLVRIPFIPVEEARLLADYLLYKSEVTHSDWM